MSSDPLLSKMDALLKKHRGEAETTPVPNAHPAGEDLPPLPDDAWLPVLTDVVAMGEPSTEITEPESILVEAVPEQHKLATIDPDVLTEQIMRELEPKLTSMLHDRLAAEIRNSLDDTLSSLLAQMDVHIHEIVREAVNDQLSKS